MSAVPSTQDRPDRIPPAEPEPAAKLPGFLEKANTVTQLAIAAILAVAGLGSLAIGVTLGPFAPQVGAAAFAASATLLTLAGLLFVKAMGSNNP